MYSHVATTAEGFTVLSSFIVAQYVSELQKVRSVTALYFTLGLVAFKRERERQNLSCNIFIVKFLTSLAASLDVIVKTMPLYVTVIPLYWPMRNVLYISFPT